MNTVLKYGFTYWMSSSVAFLWEGGGEEGERLKGSGMKHMRLILFHSIVFFLCMIFL